MSNNNMISTGRLPWLGRPFAYVASHLRDRWIEPARRAHRRRRDLKMLLHLDQRTLEDIGLQRADLMAAVYHGVPLERLTAHRHESGQSTVVPMPRPAAGPARDFDAAA